MYKRQLQFHHGVADHGQYGRHRFVVQAGLVLGPRAADAHGRGKSGEHGLVRLPAAQGLAVSGRIGHFQAIGSEGQQTAASPRQLTGFLEGGLVGGGEVTAAAPQPVLDPLVRRLPGERRRGLGQESVVQRGLSARHDAVAVQNGGLRVEEIDQLGAGEGERQVTLADRTVRLRVHGDDEQVFRRAHERLPSESSEVGSR